jgi:hypothetical protein
MRSYTLLREVCRYAEVTRFTPVRNADMASSNCRSFDFVRDSNHDDDLPTGSQPIQYGPWFTKTMYPVPTL